MGEKYSGYSLDQIKFSAEDTKFDSKQMEIGKKIEAEHKRTYEKIKEYLDENDKLPPADEVYQWIAEDHLLEIDDYYTRLVKMEEEAEAKEE